MYVPQRQNGKWWNLISRLCWGFLKPAGKQIPQNKLVKLGDDVSHNLVTSMAKCCIAVLDLEKKSTKQQSALGELSGYYNSVKTGQSQLSFYSTLPHLQIFMKKLAKLFEILIVNLHKKQGVLYRLGIKILQRQTLTLKLRGCPNWIYETV